jgi:hypothetical protein
MDDFNAAVGVMGSVLVLAAIWNLAGMWWALLSLGCILVLAALSEK